MLVDVLLAIAHFLLIFVLLAILVAQMTTVKPGIGARQLSLVGAMDLAYGIAAGLLLVVGFGRVFFGLKGAAFYLTNHSFWTKIALFAVVALLSIQPTLRFIAWRRSAAADQAFTPPEVEIKRVRMFMHLEATVFFIIPVFAVLMARGIG